MKLLHHRKNRDNIIQELKAKRRRVFMLTTMNWACSKGGFIIMGIICHNSAHRQTVYVIEETIVDTVVQSQNWEDIGLR